MYNFAFDDFKNSMYIHKYVRYTLFLKNDRSLIIGEKSIQRKI